VSTITQHTAERLTQRVNAEDRASVAQAVAGALSACERAGVTDAAVRVWRAASKVRTQDGSNGETAVLVVRGGQGATLMWRRLSQPHTTAALRVERVLCVRGTCDAREHASHR
jgi:hypothetical protein